MKFDYVTISSYITYIALTTLRAYLKRDMSAEIIEFLTKALLISHKTFNPTPYLLSRHQDLNIIFFEITSKWKT